MIQRNEADSRVHSLESSPEDSLNKVLRRLVGRTIIVVSPDHFEPSPTGCSVRSRCYEAKVLDVGERHLVLEYYARVSRGSRSQAEERAREFIPLEHVRRVTITSSRRTIHL